MAILEVVLRFKTDDSGVIKGLLGYLDELREREEASAISVHVRYVEG